MMGHEAQTQYLIYTIVSAALSIVSRDFVERVHTSNMKCIRFNKHILHVMIFGCTGRSQKLNIIKTRINLMMLE